MLEANKIYKLIYKVFSKKEKEMGNYLLDVTIYDGEHEHRTFGLVKAKSSDEALELAEKETHEANWGSKDNPLGFWDYGDGLTASRVKGVREITDEQLKVLQDLRITYFIN
jgi:hypothetical protein